MKRLLLFTIAMACALSVAAQKFNFNKNVVVAHRGAWKEAGLPQNSIASWREAVRLGCHGSECDVHITADDSLVVFHNLTHHGVVIKDSPYAELVKYPLKNGEKIPSFREYLAEVKKQNTTKLIVDVKTMISDDYSLRLSREIVRVINEMGAMEWCEFLGSNVKALQYIQRVTGRRVAYLGKWREELPDMHPDKVRANGFEAVDYQNIFYFAHPDWVKTFKKRGIHLNAWTINREEDMDWFIKHKFDYITTDYPAKLLKRVEYQAR
jgi:glycerophosphoryl diester phosphodiesterase